MLKNTFDLLARPRLHLDRRQFQQMIVNRETFTGHLNIYYDEVISCIRDAESILIFGPGEAKGQVKNVLREKNSVDA